MKFFVNNPGKFRKKSDVPNCWSPKTKIAKSKRCENDLYVENENHLAILNQNPVVIIARIFNMLPVPVKMMDDKKKFICKIREIVYENQFYDMNEFANLIHRKKEKTHTIMTYFKLCQ